MTTAYTLYADISAYINPLLEGSLETMAQRNVLVPTVTVFRDTAGMNPRKVYRWNSTTPHALGEAEDMTPDQISKTLVTTITPLRYGNQVVISDERLNTDWENVRNETVMLLGEGAARYIDQSIGALTPSLTGGTVGAGGGTIGWTQIYAAYAMAVQKNIPGPYTCALAPGQWFHLINNGGTTITSTFMRSPAFQDRIINNYFINAMFGDVTFAISNGISGAGGGTCYGALYNREALAYDERTGLVLEPQRDASRSAWELNVNFRFAASTYDSLKGIQLIGTDVIPTT